MKVKTYVRIAKMTNGKPKVTATSKPSDAPLNDTYGAPLPTVAFAVEFVLPDEAFRRASQLIATVDIQSPEPLATVHQIKAS